MARTPRKWQGARNPSGLKRVRQAERRHAILQPRRSAAKTLVAKAVTVATAQPESADVATSLSAAISALDRAAKAGAIHPNAAARRKSRLTHQGQRRRGWRGRRERRPRREVHRQGRSGEGRQGPHRRRQGRQGQGRPDRRRQGTRRPLARPPAPRPLRPRPPVAEAPSRQDDAAPRPRRRRPLPSRAAKAPRPRPPPTRRRREDRGHEDRPKAADQGGRRRPTAKAAAKPPRRPRREDARRPRRPSSPRLLAISRTPRSSTGAFSRPRQRLRARVRAA